MSYIDPAAAEYLCRRWTRPDAYRFAPPGSPDAKMPGFLDPRRWPHEVAAAEEQAADPAFRAKVEALRAGHQRLRIMIAEVKFALALRALGRKYSADQPRVPAGNPDGGQWADGGAGEHAPKDRGSDRTRLAGEIPTNDPPEVPKQRPAASRERTAIVRTIATWLARYGGPLGRIAAGAYWLYQYDAQIRAVADPARSLEELQQAVADPRAGYDIHHVVEQTAARQDGFDESQIEAPDNLVRIPTLKHWEINAWYQTKNEDFGGLSPREYLRGKDWDERRAVGLRALADTGVLKP